MFVDEAEDILLDKYPNEKLISVVDCNDYFVFNTIPKKGDEQKNKRMLKPLKAVLKSDGRIMFFTPLHHKDSDYHKKVKTNIHYY